MASLMVAVVAALMTAVLATEVMPMGTITMAV